MREKYPRTKAVRELLTLLGEYSASDRIMFGQQNAGHIGISIENTTTLNEEGARVFAALTGDQVALTDIRLLNGA